MSTPETKTIKTRFQLKNDTPANWATASQNSFIPLQGEPILYKDGTTGEIYGMKVGDGTHTPDNLDFICDNTQSGSAAEPNLILTFKTTSANNSVTLRNLTNMSSIDWGDGTTDSTLSHTYSTAGTYICKIYGVTAIGGNNSIMSSGTSYLKKVSVGDVFTAIGNYAFYNFTSLYEVNLPETITSIGTYSFYKTTSLREINLPETITTLGERCFYQGGLYSIKTPPNIYQIPQYAFAQCPLMRVELTGAVNNIAQYAFYNCTSLYEITIPASCVAIYGHVFEDCTKLSRVTFKCLTDPSYSRLINNGSNFKGCTRLGYIFIEDTRSFIIGSSDVQNTNANLRIYVQDYLLSSFKTTNSSIASKFYSNVTQPQLNTSNPTTSTAAQYLGQLYINTTTNAVFICTAINNSTYTWNEVGGIDIGAIKGTPTILRLEIPSASTSVGFWMNVDCTYIDWGDGTTTDGNTYSHTYSTAGTKFIMVYGVTDISGDMGEPWLSNGYSYLTGVTFGSTVTTIGNIAFTGCTALKEVTFSEYVTTIDYSAFYGCTTLKNVKLPPSLDSMSDGAFADCTNLEVVEFLGSNPPSSLMDTPMDPLFPSTTTLIVPKGATSAYTTAFGILSNTYTFTEYSTGGGGGGGATWHSVYSSSATVTLAGACTVVTVCFRGGDAPSYDYFGTSTITIINDPDPIEIRGTVDGYGQYATAYGSNFDPVTSTYTEATISINSGATIQGYFTYQ